MSDLYPTKARLELLGHVERGEVVEYQWDDEHPSFWQRGLQGRGLLVTDRIRTLRFARWVELAPAPGHHVYKWRLTEAGRKVLEAGRG